MDKQVAYATRTAIKCKMKEFIDFAHETNGGDPVDDDFIKENIDYICIIMTEDFDE